MGSTVERSLDRTTREELLQLARQLAERCGQKAGRQAVAALAILRADGTAGLRDAVRRDLRVELGANTPHWCRFRDVCSEDLVRTATKGPTHAAFLLTWLARLARATEPQGVHRGQSPPKTRRR